MKRLLRQQFWLILLLLALICPSLPAQIAVVVHPDNPIADISLNDLERIYKGKVTSFKSGASIVLTENAELDEEFYKIVTDMSLRRFRKHWMKIVFEGTYATPPTAFDDLAELRTFIGHNPGAIGFIEFSAVDSTLKALTVGGLNPEDEDYPLKIDKSAEETE